MMRRFILTLTMLCTPFFAHAAFVSLDWKTSGDALITRDTATGLEWLDITETTERSFTDVKSQFSVGGEFSGFRYASDTEVIQLLRNFGFNNFDSYYHAEDFQAGSDFFEYLGINSFIPAVAGRSGTISSPGYNQGIFVAACFSNDPVYCAGDINNESRMQGEKAYVRMAEINFDTVGFMYANWLVRDKSLSVPEPALLLFLLLALCTVYITRGRKASPVA
jgi:hypothetical protein